MLKDLLVNGIISGAGSVLVFLPNILILFFFISLLEGTGYMARAAFIMDKIMHRFGLHGRSFIPLIMGFGCNVPAILATRSMRNRGDRILTMLIIPFMSCSARLPVYILIISAFFKEYQTFYLTGIYATGIFIAFLTAQILNKTVFKNKETPFVMELPTYRMPHSGTLSITCGKNSTTSGKSGQLSLLVWSSSGRWNIFRVKPGIQHNTKPNWNKSDRTISYGNRKRRVDERDSSATGKRSTDQLIPGAAWKGHPACGTTTWFRLENEHQPAGRVTAKEIVVSTMGFCTKVAKTQPTYRINFSTNYMKAENGKEKKYLPGLLHWHFWFLSSSISRVSGWWQPSKTNRDLGNWRHLPFFTPLRSRGLLLLWFTTLEIS